MIALYKSNAVVENAHDSIMEDTEIASYLHVSTNEVKALRHNWVANFVKSGGIRLLLQILNDMNQISQLQKKSEILQTKIEKDCWNQILRILKVLLMSTFVAKLPSPELSSALQRRLSH